MSRLSPRLCTVLGPDTLGVGQREHFTMRWTLWFGSHGVRIVQGEHQWIPGDAVGEECEVFHHTLADHMSACFDQTSRPVVAIERNDGMVEIRKISAGSQTAWSFEGRQPQLYFNWEVLYYHGESDVVCIYLKEDGRTLFARLQRDSFAVEYTLNTLHATLGTLEETASLATHRQVIYGRTIGGRVISLVSREYPPWPALAQDTADHATDVEDSEHQLAVIVVSDSEGGTLEQGIEAGSYFLAVIQQSADDAGFSGSDVEDSEYRLVIVQSEQADAGNLASDVEPGSYTLIVVPTSAEDSGSVNSDVDESRYFQAVINSGTRHDEAFCGCDVADSSHLPP